MTSVKPEEVKKFLLCKDFTPQELENFASKLSAVFLHKGEVLFEEGAIGDSMYFILSGKVRVFKKYNGDMLVFSEMKEGNFFGEMSLIDELPRSAAVSAIEDCKLMVLYRNDFNLFIKESPFAGVKYVLAMTKELSRRIRKTNQNLEDYHFMCRGLIENEKFRELYKSIIH